MSSVICVLVNCFNCITVQCNRLRFVNRIVSIKNIIIISMAACLKGLLFFFCMILAYLLNVGFMRNNKTYPIEELLGYVAAIAKQETSASGCESLSHTCCQCRLIL